MERVGERKVEGLFRKRFTRVLRRALPTLWILSATAAVSAHDKFVWHDAEGKPVSFASRAVLEDYLRTAEVLQMKSIPTGVAGARRVLLEQDGIRMNACFRTVSVHQSQTRFASGAVKLNFRDDAIFEVAAYRLSRLLGYPNVPPTVARRIHRQKGTLQAWVAGAVTETERVRKGLQPPDSRRWALELQAMHLFDALIYNEDRNRGNILLDQAGRLWMIDHTRSFLNHSEPMNLKSVRKVEQGIWTRLQSVPDSVIETELKEVLNVPQIRALLKRRERLVGHLRALIEDRGEGAVIYVLWPDDQD